MVGAAKLPKGRQKTMVSTIGRLVLTIGRLVLTIGRLVLTIGRLVLTIVFLRPFGATFPEMCIKGSTGAGGIAAGSADDDLAAAVDVDAGGVGLGVEVSAVEGVPVGVASLPCFS